MHVLYVCDEYPPAGHGGMGVVVRGLAEGVARKGFSVSVVGYYEDLPRSTSEIINGVAVHRLPLPKLGKLTQFYKRISLYRWVERYISAKSVEIVEYPDFQSSLWRLHSVPSVVRLHGSNSFLALLAGTRVTWATRRFERRALSIADCVVGVSQFALDFTSTNIGINQNSFRTVIYNFVDTESLGIGAGEPTNIILFWGTLTAKKGVFTLIRAANLFLKELPDAELHLIGRDTKAENSTCAEQLTLLIHQDVAPRIKISGAVSHDKLPEIIQRARLCVLPSVAESFGISVIEAMSCGKPVVCTNIPPFREIVSEGEDGILVEPGNVRELAEQVIRLYKNEEVGNSLGRAAFQKVRNLFSEEAQIRKNIQLYERMTRDR